MLNSFLKENSSRLSRQLVSSILILYFIVAVAFTTFQLGSEFHYEKKRLANQVTQIAETIRPALTEALWNFDTPQLEATMIGAYRNMEVFGIKVSSDKPQPWRLGYTKKDETTATISGDPPELITYNDIIHMEMEGVETKALDLTQPGIELYSLTFQLSKKDEGTIENIGLQTLYFSSNTIFERVWMTFLITIMGSIIKTFALWVISIFVITKLVSKPLKELTQAIEKFSPDSVDEDNIIIHKNDLKKNNELSFLQRSFKNFCQELIRRNLKINYNEDSQKTIIQAKTRYLQEITKELTKANQIKTDFLSSMTHELRTPLNAVIGCSQLLQKSQLTEKEHHLVKNIYNSSQTLLVLISDILDISKIEAGKLEIEEIPFNLVEKVYDTVECLRILAENKGVQYNIQLPDNEDLIYIVGDPTRIIQVVNNLVSNAIKFTKEGNIDFTLILHPIESERVHIDITVQDTGIGMTQTQKDSLFQVFTQADASTTRKYGGTGLGLAISKRIIEEMGGTVSVESTPGKGSKFFIQLTLPKADKHTIDTPIKEERSSAQNEIRVSQQRPSDQLQQLPSNSEPDPVQTHEHEKNALIILLVDDVELNREVTGFMLEDAGYDILEAEDGQQAYELFKERYQNISLVLMDCQMPILDGYSATELIREYEQENDLPNLPILALTANATKESQEQCFLSGMNNFITKPLDETVLLNAIEKSLHEKA